MVKLPLQSDGDWQLQLEVSNVEDSPEHIAFLLLTFFNKLLKIFIVVMW